MNYCNQQAHLCYWGITNSVFHRSVRCLAFCPGLTITIEQQNIFSTLVLRSAAVAGGDEWMKSPTAQMPNVARKFQQHFNIMAYIDFDPKTNSIRIVKGIVKHEIELTEIEALGGMYSIFKEKEDFKGIRLNNYLSDLELKGTKAENLFKSLLDENDVPFLYIGQGPLGLERSNVLKDKMKSKRPDFLVNLPDMGILFFDVKCRQKKGFPTSSRAYFQLFKNEIIGLINLHEQLLVPVWIAFVDEFIISDDKSTKPEFYLIPISLLKKYFDQLKENLSERENEMLTSVRIPDELLYEVKEKFAFKVGVSSINEELAKSFAKNYKGLIRRIEDKIKDCIRTTSVLKTNLSQTIIKDTSKFAFRNEVENILLKLINEKVIEYEPKKPLSLLGE